MSNIQIAQQILMEFKTWSMIRVSSWDRTTIKAQSSS